MNIQLVSNQSQKYQQYLEWIQRELPFITCTPDDKIKPEQNLLLIFPDQYIVFAEKFISEDIKGKAWYIFLDEDLTEEQRCQLLNRGIDTIWTYSLSQREFLARLKAFLRLMERNQLPEVLAYNQEELVLQMQTQQVYIEGQEVSLTTSEYQLLLQFMQHPNRIYSRDELLVLLNNQRGTNRAIDTHIKNLRRKIAVKKRNFEYIRTIHGRGYRFELENKE